MRETKKIVRIYILSVVWILFVTLTLSGIVIAGERTESVRSGKEPETIIFTLG